MVLRLCYGAGRFPLAALATLALSGGIAAQEISPVFCQRIATSGFVTSPVNSEPFITAWLHIGKYVCGDEAEEPSGTTIDGQVDAVAAAIAEDFVVITTSCQAGGNAEVRAQAFAYVEARAEAVGVIVEDIFARSAEVCGRCPAAVSALSEAAQVLIAEAVAEAWTQLFLLSDGGDAGPVASSSIAVETISTALAAVAATIRAGANDGCSIAAIDAAQ